MFGERLRTLVKTLAVRYAGTRIHCAPAIPVDAHGLLEATCGSRQADEQILLFIDVSEEGSLDEGLVLTEAALYASSLPDCRLPLKELLSETFATREGEGWLYVNDLLLCTLPETAPELPDLLLPLLRSIRLLRYEGRMSDSLELKSEEEESTRAWLEDLLHPSTEAALIAGKYRLLRELGKGTYGVVSLARDIRLDKLVAVKQLTYHSSRNARSQARFIQEARALSRLSNPHIASVYALDYCNGDYYLVMEYLCGGSLAEWLDRERQPTISDVIAICRDVLTALEGAHARGIVHRDLKPGNILFDEHGRAKLTDFGIAYVPTEIGGLHLTTRGTPVGTILYMAPEQVSSEPVDGRCDLYAMGALMYRMLSGDTYLDRRMCRSLHLAFQEILNGQVPPLHDVPEPLAAYVYRLLQKRPDDRFPTAVEARKALDRVAASLDATPKVATVIPATMEETRQESEQAFTNGMEKYRKALSLALVDGVLVQREREMLEGLAARWCVAPHDAERLQAEALREAGLCYSVHNILEIEEMVRIFLTDGMLQEPERAMLMERAATYGVSLEVLQNVIHIVANELGVNLPQ